MTDEMQILEAPAVRRRAEREAMGEASDILKKPGNLTLSIYTLLFCLLVSFAWFTATRLLSIPFEAVLSQMESIPAMLVFEGVYYLVIGVLFFLLVAPAWLGRLRASGLMCAEKHPMVREVLYYFTSPARYRRALVLSLVLAVQVLLPLLICSLAFFGAFELYFEIFFFEFSPIVAVLLLIALLVAVAALCVGVLLLTGLYQLTAAIAVGNEELSVFAALRLAMRRGKGNLPTLFRFSMRALWHLLLSLVTFGVLFVLWYAHHYITSYLRLSMALCPKGETPS